MNQTKILICVSYIFLASLVAEGYIGVNWGRLATQRMIPSMVVDLLLQNNISEVKVFSASDNVLEAFGGTGINLAITMPNTEIKSMTEASIVNQWVQSNVMHFLQMNLSFRYVYIGIEPLSRAYGNQTYDDCVTVMGVMQRVLDSKNITGVKATISHSPDILNLPLTKPSMAEFRPDLKELMFNLCSILKTNNAPFGIGFAPLLLAIENFKNDTEFAFFDNNSTSKFTDGQFIYSNVFQVVYDSVVCAIEKLGFFDIPIVVGTIGWPTDGIPGGNLQNAERFHQGLAKFIRTQKGTPRRPGINIDVYIHNIADENAASIAAGPYMRHWGIYRFDGQPKFNIDFEGKERKVLPVSAVGITHMPRRWCVLDVTKVDPNQIPYETLNEYFDSTCEAVDCTAASPGGSCSSLPYPLNYSYAFNVGFQFRRQRMQGKFSCDYGGYGVIVAEDPSTAHCSFPVEIIAAETTNFLGQGVSQVSSSAGPPCFISINLMIIAQFLFFIFFLTLTRTC